VKPVQELARKKTKAALDVLAAIATCDDKPPAVRVAAASAILDRAFGKPSQQVNLDAQLGVRHEDALDALE